jgi:uncharacterized protein (TIGR00299 family) protein
VRIAYFDCFAGISGDMTLAALVDAGADFDSLQRELAKLGLKELEVECGKVVKRGISATDITIHVHQTHHHHNEPGHHGHYHNHGRSFIEIKELIEHSGLSQGVKERSVAIFRRLGEAEAAIHSKSINEIHFHEVGAVDAIADIVGACICLDLLGVERIYASAMPTFHGTVEMAHGTFPLPAPATLALLKGAPWRGKSVEGELVTPTGAAILSELACGFGEMPEMSVESIGYGAGKLDFERPNVLRVMIGEASESDANAREEICVLETNIDDLNPQVYDVVMERLFAAGALDVFFTSVQMKKNRPATLVTALCALGDESALMDVLFTETTTIGVRTSRQSRVCLPREKVVVDTRYGKITMKIARKKGKVINVQAEFEDCKAAAAKHGVAVKRVRDEAIAKFYATL